MNKENCRYCLKSMEDSFNTEIVNGVEIFAHKHCIEKFALNNDSEVVK